MVLNQMKQALADDANLAEKLTVAYEPVWAIGQGVPQLEQADEMRLYRSNYYRVLR